MNWGYIMDLQNIKQLATETSEGGFRHNGGIQIWQNKGCPTSGQSPIKSVRLRMRHFEYDNINQKRTESKSSRRYGKLKSKIRTGQEANLRKAAVSRDLIKHWIVTSVRVRDEKEKKD